MCLLFLAEATSLKTVVQHMWLHYQDTYNLCHQLSKSIKLNDIKLNFMHSNLLIIFVFLFVIISLEPAPGTL